MKSEEWPIAASTADFPVDPARCAGGGRLHTVRRDFFLNPGERLNEQERALMTAMLENLLASMADEIIAALPSGLDMLGEEGHDPLIARLWTCGLLDRPALVALLLRSADEQRISTAFQPKTQGTAPLVQRLVGDEDGDIAAAAMAVAIARGRRRDRFGRGRLLLDDLPPEEAAALAYAIAAGIRAPLPAHPAIDRSLGQAAQSLLSRHAHGERIDGLLASLVSLLDQAGQAGNPIVEEAASEGDVALLAALLAHRAEIPEGTAWEHLVWGGRGRLVLLARVAGLPRPTAARLIAELGSLTGIEDPAGELMSFDRLGSELIEDARSEWSLPSGYQAARRCLGRGHG